MIKENINKIINDYQKAINCLTEIANDKSFPEINKIGQACHVTKDARTIVNKLESVNPKIEDFECIIESDELRLRLNSIPAFAQQQAKEQGFLNQIEQFVKEVQNVYDTYEQYLSGKKQEMDVEVSLATSTISQQKPQGAEVIKQIVDLFALLRGRSGKGIPD